MKLNQKLTAMLLIVVISVSMLMTGCGSSAPAAPAAPAAAPAAAPEGQTETPAAAPAKEDVTIAISAEPSTLGSWLCNDLTSKAVANNLYDTLIRLESDGTLNPGLATEWEYNDDHTEITFTLREDVKFHNGDTMTADDVVFSINTAIENAGTTKRMTGTFDRMEKIDETHVKLYQNIAYGAVENCLTSENCGIVCKAAYEADPDGFSRNPVGTGPYKLDSWNAGEKIVFTANEDYWREAPAIKTVTWKFVGDTTAALVALETGDIDALDAPSTADYQYIEDTQGLSLSTAFLTQGWYVVFNMNEGHPFADENLRKAVALAVNKEDFVIGAMDGHASVSEGAIPANCVGAPAGFKGYEQDIEAAKQALAESSYNGETIKVTLMSSGYYPKMGETLKEALRQIGLNVELDMQERATAIESINSSTFDLGCWSWSALIADADQSAYVRFHSSCLGYGNNFVGVNDPVIDEALDGGRFGKTLADREAAYAEFEEAIKENYYIVPLLLPEYAIAYNSDLNGVTATAVKRIYLYDWSWGA